MIRGMTGYGRSSREVAGLTIAVEVRTVNHRYSEVQLRMPRALAAEEAALRRHIGERLGRGRADVTIRLDRAGGEPCEVELSRAFVAGLLQAADVLKKEFALPGSLRVETVLGFPDAVTARPVDAGFGDDERAALVAAVDEALHGVDAMRLEEGRVMEADLRGRLATVGRLNEAIRQRAGELPGLARARLAQRLEALLAGDARLDEGRLEQEVAILADRCDVTEELVRLAGYVEQAAAILDDGGESHGRRLDFLLQEMNREINTIGSKAGDAEMGGLVVDVKQELERIREQVQNIA